MTLSQLLECASNDLSLFEPIGDVLVDREAPLNVHEKILLTLWIYVATNPGWSPPPVERSDVELSLRAVGKDELAAQLPDVITPPDFNTASQVVNACARYIRTHGSELDLGEDLRMRAPDACTPMPMERMASIFRKAQDT